MDYLAFTGLLLGIIAILGGQFIEGGSLAALINGPAFLIVVGGTLGATILQSPLHVFVRSMRGLPKAFRAHKTNENDILAKIINWSHIARKDGLLGLEGALDFERDKFTYKGLTLLVDGNEPEVIRNVLELEINMREEYDLQAAKVYQAMGGYSPTIGIIGAVIGLIHVMYNLTDPARLGEGIATAFVATIYGVGLANLVFLPIANKLKNIVYDTSKQHEMIMEGIIAIAEGENPRYIEMKLRSFHR